MSLTLRVEEGHIPAPQQATLALGDTITVGAAPSQNPLQPLASVGLFHMSPPLK